MILLKKITIWYINSEFRYKIKYQVIWLVNFTHELIKTFRISSRFWKMKKKKKKMMIKWKDLLKLEKKNMHRNNLPNIIIQYYYKSRSQQFRCCSRIQRLTFYKLARLLDYTNWVRTLWKNFGSVYMYSWM